MLQQNLLKKQHILSYVTFSFENRTVYEITWKQNCRATNGNIEHPFACWVP